MTTRGTAYVRAALGPADERVGWDVVIVAPDGRTTWADRLPTRELARRHADLWNHPIG